MTDVAIIAIVAFFISALIAYYAVIVAYLSFRFCIGFYRGARDSWRAR